MDNEELLQKIEELESRIAALEQDRDACDDAVCPERGENPCVCDEPTDEEDNSGADDLPSDDEIGEIDDDDVDKIEELDFDIPSFDGIKDEEGEAGGLYDHSSNEEDEDSPYYGG